MKISVEMLAALVLFCGVQVSAQDFSDRQSWSSPAIRYQNSLDECREVATRSAKGNAIWACEHHYNGNISLCGSVTPEVNNSSDSTNRFGSECTVVVTIRVPDVKK